MYRIELTPGEETALRTIDELAIGIRNGVITSRARIWHNAGQKWLPIQFHPHYQAALKQLEGDSSDSSPTQAASPAAVMPAAVPISKDRQQEPTSPPAFAAEPPSHEAANKAEAAPPALLPADESGRPRSVRRPIGLLAGGLVLIAGARWVTSASANDAAPSVAQMAATVTPSSIREPAAPRAKAAAPTAAVAAPVRAPAPTPPHEADNDVPTSAAPAPAAEPPKRTFDGGVVRGPDMTVPVPPPAQQESSEEDDEPPLPPAPVMNSVPIPTLSPDTTR